MVFLDFVQIRALKSESSIQIIRATSGTNNPLTMKLTSSDFKDNRVRTAFKLAVDREAMVKQVLLGEGKVGNDVFGYNFASYNNHLPQRKYDPEKARALLKKAGRDGITVALYTSQAIAGMLESATVFRQQAKAAGIKVNLQKLAADSYFSNNKYLKVPFYQSFWEESFEQVTRDGLLSNAPYNETGWRRPQFDNAFHVAEGIADEQKRNQRYRDLAVPLWREGGYIIWGFQNKVDAASAKIKGIVPNPFRNLGHLQVKDWWISG
jgi:peptide/nickel transport system substrate-binding protein